MDEAAAAPGLRTAVEFYTGKVDRLRQRQVDLEAELGAVRAELDKVSATRDQLAEDLEEILAETPASPTDEATSAQGATSTAGTDGAPPRPEAKADNSGDHAQPRNPFPDGSSPRSGSGELMQAVVQILVTAGRPLPVRDITEALGRPVNGQEGRGPIETTRATCKRLVKNGRAVEDPVGVFAIARTEDSSVKGAA
jgi:hypothetical protein